MLAFGAIFAAVSRPNKLPTASPQSTQSTRAGGLEGSGPCDFSQEGSETSLYGLEKDHPFGGCAAISRYLEFQLVSGET